MTTPLPARAFCQRLQLIALAMMTGQLLYLIVGWLVAHGRSGGVLHDSPQRAIIVQSAFGLGIVLIGLSHLTTRRPAATLPEFGKLFFVGFGVTEAGALIGLALCFLFSEFTPLLILAIATIGSIYTHYLTITRRILASRELNPLG